MTAGGTTRFQASGSIMATPESRRKFPLALHVRHPVWLSMAPGQAAWAFATLFLIESVARASVSTVLPLHAYDLLKDKGQVSLAYTGVALAALVLSFAIPYMIRFLSRRWSYTIGAGLLALCGLLLATDTIPGQLGAMFARTFGAATLNITLNLYIMDHIQKSELVRSEPLRYAISTFAWMAAPLAGVWLYQNWGVAAVAVMPVAGAAVLAATFWYLRMSEKGPIRAAQMLPPSPFASIGRFVAQPRLRLAWLIAFARSSFWVTFFIYVPILLVEGGYGPIAGGVAIAAGNAMLFNNLLVTRWARRHSLRRMLALSLTGGASLTVAAGVFGPSQALAASITIVAAAFFISMLDGLGPIPFMRAVRVHERPQMTTVYRTYLDASELIPPFVYFFAFMAFGFSGAFYVLAILLAATGAVVWKFIPHKL